MPRRKSTKNIRTVTDLVRSFSVDGKLSPAERLAAFLNYAADVLPYRFIDRRYCAQIAFAKKRIPSAESDAVKKLLPNIMTSVKNTLHRDPYLRDVHTDRIDGVRATVDDSDIVVTTYRKKQKSVVSAIKSLEKTDALVDASKTQGEIRKELLRGRKNNKFLAEYKKAAPLLPPAKVTSDV